MSSRANSSEEIRYESNIVWLKDINDIPYVREHFDRNCSRRKGKLTYQGHEIVGYAELDDKAPSTNRNFSRRVFWLSPYDRALDPETYKIGCPIEAVDPKTVFPGVMGEITERAWGESLPPDFKQNR